MEITTIGIDVAKDVSGVHGVDGRGQVTMRERLVRKHLLEFMSKFAGVPSGPGSLHQRALLGARARAAGPSGKAHEPAVREAVPQERKE